MEFTSSLLLHNQQYILLLAVVMAISFSAKKSQIFLPFYSWIARTVKSKRAVVAIISFVSGILPISGRVAVSAGALDTIAPTDVKKRKNFGIIDYLSTHHFYFWSPLEATVITPMAVLGISYWSFMGKIWPLLLTAVTIILFYIFKVLKEDDIDIVIPEKNTKKEKEEWQKQADIKADRRQIIEYSKVLVFTSLVIILGNVVKANFDTINEWVKSAHDHNLIIFVALVGFLASLSLGSSGKFAGFVGISTSVFGAGALPLFFAFDYAGYMLSPTHKCLVVGKSYFKTPLKDYYKAIASLVVPLMLVGTALYFMGLDL
jgi:hypothetical protein